ncbi:MAG: hypothetical protein P8O03_14685 [Ilumatobacter sp.]|nr:hypothetical protein [bacterium]MDG1267560.1 hypothetical protein [Ilumatobacter sp.]NKB39869.1 hypothetical protein [Ilumatobacter sp.]
MSISPPPTGYHSNETSTEYTLVGGPRWYHRRIRMFGPFLGLLIPGAVGAIAYVSLQISDASWSGSVGLIGGYFAAPTLLAVGAPFADRNVYPIAAAAAAVMWLFVGILAARRSTRHPMAAWGDFWRHYLWMLAGIWIGVSVALAVATVRIGSGIVDWQ